MTALLRDAARRLAGIDAGNPHLEAEYLLAAALECERVELFRRRAEGPVPLDAIARFESLLARRLSREPLQYVLGTVPFCGLDLVIGPGALIPRSETEVLVEEVAKRLAGGPAETTGDLPVDAGTGRAPLLIDVGTGSGAILLALLTRLPGWRGIGIDRSPRALEWARRNAAHVAESRTRLVRGDLLESTRDVSVDAVLSNPPYIRSAEIPSLAPEIRDHEPSEALDGGDDGLDAVRRLVPEAVRVLRPGGLLALELAPEQPESVAAILSMSGMFTPSTIFQDLAGRKRGVIARKRANA